MVKNKNKNGKMPLNSFAKTNNKINIHMVILAEIREWYGGNFTDYLCNRNVFALFLFLCGACDYMKQVGKINGYTKKLCSGNGLIVCKCCFTFSDS